MIPKDLQDYIDAKKNLQAQGKLLGQQSIKGLFLEFFEGHPEVEQLRWTQYTPSFNDGDPCTFDVYEPSVKLSGEHVKSDEDDEDKEFQESWDIRGTHKDLAKSLQDLYGRMQDLSEVLLTIFGDGSEITITRTGDINIDEYYHD